MRIVSESEFRLALVEKIALLRRGDFGFVTGPGRSGALAAVYVSHSMGLPFVPYKSLPSPEIGRALLVDTARQSGRTMRRAERVYGAFDPLGVVFFEEPPRVRFWYEF